MLYKVDIFAVAMCLYVVYALISLKRCDIITGIHCSID